MKKLFFLSVAFVFLLTMAIIPVALCYPPAGLYHLDPTTATIELQIIGLFNETITVKGPTDIYNKDNPYDPGDGHITINTEIVSMNLVGTSMHIGNVTVAESPTKASNGTVRQWYVGQDYPANSSFKVFIEIQTVFGTFHNDNPAFMSAKIDEIPPWGATYTSPPNQTIPLKNATDFTIGFIKHVSHKLPPKAAPVGGTSVPIIASPDVFSLLAPYIGLTSTMLVATVATAICVKRVKHRKEKR